MLSFPIYSEAMEQHTNEGWAELRSGRVIVLLQRHPPCSYQPEEVRILLRMVSIIIRQFSS